MINVTCGIILEDTKVLVTQRSEKMQLPLKWEFPGGKIELNETAEMCICRELKEELNIEIKILKRLKSQPFHYDSFSINLIPFVAGLTCGEVILKEHKAFKWLTIDQLRSVDWAPADISVLDEFLGSHTLSLS